MILSVLFSFVSFIPCTVIYEIWSFIHGMLSDAARSNVDAKRIKVDDEDVGEELAISVR